MYHQISFLLHSAPQTEVIIFSLVFFAWWNIENITCLLGDHRKWSHAFLNSKFIITGLPPQIGLIKMPFGKYIRSGKFD